MKLVTRREFSYLTTWDRVVKESGLPETWEFYKLKHKDLRLTGDKYANYVELFQREATTLGKLLSGLEQ